MQVTGATSTWGPRWRGPGGCQISARPAAVSGGASAAPDLPPRKLADGPGQSLPARSVWSLRENETFESGSRKRFCPRRSILGFPQKHNRHLFIPRAALWAGRQPLCAGCGGGTSCPRIPPVRPTCTSHLRILPTHPTLHSTPHPSCSQPLVGPQQAVVRDTAPWELCEVGTRSSPKPGTGHLTSCSWKNACVRRDFRSSDSA